MTYTVKISMKSGDPTKVSAEYECVSYPNIRYKVIQMFHANGQSTVIPLDNVYWATIIPNE